MKTLLTLLLSILPIYAAVPTGGLRINNDTTGTNTTSARVTVTELTNLNTGSIVITNVGASKIVKTDAGSKSAAATDGTDFLSPTTGAIMDTQQITWVAVAFGATQAFISLMTWLNTRASNQKISENTQLTKQVHDRVDQQSSTLTTTQISLAREQGWREGASSEQEKQTLYAKIIMKQASDRTQTIIRLNECLTSNGAFRLKALVVEDNEIDAISICRGLDSLHLTCDVVNTGVEAIKKLGTDGYSVAFVDLSLQCDITGLQLIKILFANNPVVPIFIVTGYGNEFIREASKQIGVVEVIDKPATEDKLRAALAKLSPASI